MTLCLLKVAVFLAILVAEVRGKDCGGTCAYAVVRSENKCKWYDTGVAGCTLQNFYDVCQDMPSTMQDGCKSDEIKKAKAVLGTSGSRSNDEYHDIAGCSDSKPCVCVTKGCNNCATTDGTVAASCVCGKLLCGQNADKTNLYCSLTSNADDNGICAPLPVCQYTDGQTANPAPCICTSVSLYEYAVYSPLQQARVGGQTTADLPYCATTTTLEQ
jgi:hypothetical protein